MLREIHLVAGICLFMLQFSLGACVHYAVFSGVKQVGCDFDQVIIVSNIFWQLNHLLFPFNIPYLIIELRLHVDFLLSISNLRSERKHTLLWKWVRFLISISSNSLSVVALTLVTAFLFGIVKFWWLIWTSVFILTDQLFLVGWDIWLLIIHDLIINLHKLVNHLVFFKLHWLLRISMEHVYLSLWNNSFLFQ